MLSDPRHAPRVKRFHTVDHAELVKLAHRAFRQRGIVIAEALQLHDDRQPRILKQREHIAKLRDRLPRPVQRIVSELFRAQILQIARAPGHAPDVAVVEHRKRPIAQQMHIKLHAEAVRHGARKRAERIFRDPRRLVVKSPVRIAELPHRAHRLRPTPRAQ